MNITFKEAMNILSKLEVVLREIMSLKKYKNIPKQTIFMIWNLKYKYSEKMCSKKIIQNIIEKHPTISKEILEVKMSKMFKKANDMGVVSKISDEKDKRIKYFVLTAKGNKMATEINNDVIKIWGKSND